MALQVLCLPSSVRRFCTAAAACGSPRHPPELLFCSRGSLCSSLSSLRTSLFVRIPHSKRPPVLGKIARGSAAASFVGSVNEVTAASGHLHKALESNKPDELVDAEQQTSTGEILKQEDALATKTPGKKYLLGKTEEELIKLSVKLGAQKYRGRQIHQLVYRTKAKQIDDFHHVPKVLRDTLVTEGWQVGRSPVHHVARSTDGTIKVLLRLEDNRLVETVGIPVNGPTGKNERLTACVSSQVGCALKCAFCATGKGGFARNLKPHEIIEQVLVIDQLFKTRVSNVVFMGMGEPLMNLPALIPALRVLNKEILIGQRMMTISTVGVPNTISRLAAYKLQCTLAISLHAPNQKLRSQLVPSAKSYPLESLLTDCRNYFLETGRRVSIEYTLLSGVNDKVEHAEELADLLHRWKLGRHVNVIPYNPVADSEFRRPNKAQVMAFVFALNNRGVTTSIRQTRGLDANAACGQLRNEFQKFAMTNFDLPVGQS